MKYLIDAIIWPSEPDETGKIMTAEKLAEFDSRDQAEAFLRRMASIAKAEREAAAEAEKTGAQLDAAIAALISGVRE